MLLPRSLRYGALHSRQDPPPTEGGDSRKADVIIAVSGRYVKQAATTKTLTSTLGDGVSCHSIVDRSLHIHLPEMGATAA